MGNKEIRQQFKSHLLDLGYVIETANYYSNTVLYYLKWLGKSDILLANATYNDLMNYVAHLQSEGKSSTMINKALKSIDLYYNYVMLPNIASTVRLKKHKTAARLFLTEKSLEAIYNLYESSSLLDQLLLGFTIYQSLELHDFMLLTTEGIDLVKCTIYIPSGKHLKNSRTLSLKAKQILPIQNYLNQKSSSSDLLFLGGYSKKQLADRLTTIHKNLKTLTKDSGIKYQHLRQLRQSRIVQWIKQHGLREAQYLSGHKGISSIERYQKQDIEDLRKQIQKFHPLG